MSYAPLQSLQTFVMGAPTTAGSGAGVMVWSPLMVAMHLMQIERRRPNRRGCAGPVGRTAGQNRMADPTSIKALRVNIDCNPQIALEPQLPHPFRQRGL